MINLANPFGSNKSEQKVYYRKCTHENNTMPWEIWAKHASTAHLGIPLKLSANIKSGSGKCDLAFSAQKAFEMETRKENLTTRTIKLSKIAKFSGELYRLRNFHDFAIVITIYI